MLNGFQKQWKPVEKLKFITQNYKFSTAIISALKVKPSWDVSRKMKAWNLLSKNFQFGVGPGDSKL